MHREKVQHIHRFTFMHNFCSGNTLFLFLLDIISRDWILNTLFGIFGAFYLKISNTECIFVVQVH